jgi:hypothetical protein
MSDTKPTRHAALQWTRFVVAFLAVLFSAWQWFEWGQASPMDELWDVVVDHGYFPTDAPNSRLQYFRSLEIPLGESLSYATCILCSITVRGRAGEVSAYWGDVTWASGTKVSAGMGTHVNGGRITLEPGVDVWSTPVIANGGAVIAGPSLHLNPLWVRGSPRFFYPGQRSYPKEGVRAFVLLLLFPGVLGGWLIWGRFRTRAEEAVRQPMRSALLGAVLFALLMTYLQGVVSIFLYIFPPLAAIYIVGPIVCWFAVVSGFALLAERLGSLAGITHRFAARVAGVALLIGLMLIPVVGLFVMVAVAMVTLGAGVRLWRWRKVQLTSSP